MSTALLIAYLSMIAVQSSGVWILDMLWGPDVAHDAETQDVESVRPDASVEVMCGGYSAAHWDRTSDILHAGGMIAAVYLLCTIPAVSSPILPSFTTLSTKLQRLLWIAPVYYLPAWVGHLLFQKDIPAVFTYGTTFRGWITGEYCSFVDLLHGGVVHEPTDLVATAVVTALIIIVVQRCTRTNATSDTSIKN